MPRQPAPQAAPALSFIAAGLAALALGGPPALAQRGPDPSFELVNNTGDALEQLFANPVGLRDWGHDRLGARRLPPGGRQLVRLDPRGGCRQDLRLVWRGGAVQDLRGVDTCLQRQLVLGAPLPPRPAPGYGAGPGYDGAPAYGAGPGYGPGYGHGAGPGAPPPPPPPVALRLENRGGRPIAFVFATPAGQPDWGRDLLEGRPLRAGARQALALPPGPCLYDVKVVYADGAAQEARGLDLCARPAVRFP
jgi:hypothetical protein